MKAKDLRGKNIEDLKDSDNPKEGEEEDQVTAAYENISKKLDSLRNGKETEDEDSDKSDEAEESEEELEEWKGPKKPDLDEEDQDQEQEDEHELRKVNLKNLEAEDTDEEPEDDEEEELEALPGTEEEEDDEPRNTKSESREENEEKEWEPKKNDPLDEENLDEDEDNEEEVNEVEKEEESEKSEEQEIEQPRRAAEREEVESGVDLPRKEPQPDTLDDLTEDNFEGRKDQEESSDEYFIPNLKGTRQESSNIGYNAPSERESFGASFSSRSSMDNNDPNNFFSQHSQPQPPKRANKFHLLVLVLIGVAVIGFTVYILKGGFGQISFTSQASPSPSPTATPEPTPTPTPEPEVNRGDFTVRVLNGTSTTGLAKTVNDKLKELGYQTANPGNATNSAFTQTLIRVKEGTQAADLLQRLILDLAPDYEAAEGPNLSKTSSNDAEVILGTK